MSFASDLREVVREADFRRLYLTRLAGQGADGLVTVALTSFVLFSPERAATAGGAATAFATLLLPYSLVGPFAGVLLDRLSRRQVLVVANLLRAGVVAVLAALVAGGVAGPLFYATGLLLLSVNRFILAALSAGLPHVVPPADLVMANSVSTTSGTLTAGAGAGLGFVLAASIGPGDGGTAVVLLLAGTGYLAAARLARRMAYALLGPDPDPARPETAEALRRVARGMADGARHVAGHRPAFRALAAIAGHRFWYGIATVVTLLLYRNYFHDPADTGAAIEGLGLVVIASVAGFLVASVVTPPVTHRMSKPSWITAVFGAAAVAEAGYVVVLTEGLMVAGAFLFGFVAQAVKLCVDTIVQEAVDDAFRGRVFSFYDVIFNVSFVLAAVFTAVAAPSDGYSPALYALIAAGYGLTAVCYGLASLRARRVSGAVTAVSAAPAPAGRRG